MLHQAKKGSQLSQWLRIDCADDVKELVHLLQRAAHNMLPSWQHRGIAVSYISIINLQLWYLDIHVGEIILLTLHLLTFLKVVNQATSTKKKVMTHVQTH